jgi:hypothetical protein
VWGYRCIERQQSGGSRCSELLCSGRAAYAQNVFLCPERAIYAQNQGGADAHREALREWLMPMPTASITEQPLSPNTRPLTPSPKPPNLYGFWVLGLGLNPTLCIKVERVRINKALARQDGCNERETHSTTSQGVGGLGPGGWVSRCGVEGVGGTSRAPRPQIPDPLLVSRCGVEGVVSRCGVEGVGGGTSRVRASRGVAALSRHCRSDLSAVI